MPDEKVDYRNTASFRNGSNVSEHSVKNVRIKKDTVQVISSSSRRSSRKSGTFGRLANRFLGSVSNFDTGMSPVKFIFIIFFTIAIVGYIFGNESGLSFTSLINHLGTAESDSFNLTAYFYMVRDVLRIDSDWGLFNFLRDFFNVLLGGLGFLLTAVGGIVDIIIFIYDLFFVLV